MLKISFVGSLQLCLHPCVQLAGGGWASFVYYLCIISGSLWNYSIRMVCKTGFDLQPY